MSKIDKDILPANGYTDIFIRSTFELIYDTLKNYQSFGIFTRKRNYLTFAYLNYEAISSKSFEDYATGFNEGSNNYYLSNDFLHNLSSISPLCIGLEVRYKRMTYMKHCGCTFESKANKYRAHIGRFIERNVITLNTLISCVENKEPVNGAKFQVTSPWGFWGNCLMPYYTILVKKVYAREMIMSIELPITSN
ncbi:hypothetical protein SNEBB_008159 [Seison nebaliae]|nr:hypothetical protein SNEBB_008159 [Seison nebaliae]